MSVQQVRYTPVKSAAGCYECVKRTKRLRRSWLILHHVAEDFPGLVFFHGGPEETHIRFCPGFISHSEDGLSIDRVAGIAGHFSSKTNGQKRVTATRMLGDSPVERGFALLTQVAPHV